MLEASDSFLLLAILFENRNTNWNQILLPTETWRHATGGELSNLCKMQIV
jgi:hypothetical protein